MLLELVKRVLDPTLYNEKDKEVLNRWVDGYCRSVKGPTFDSDFSLTQEQQDAG